MLWIITGTVISYLLGSIPTAYIFGRLLKGIDIRKFGSGNVGATNAMRVLGKTPGITVLILDTIKGFIAVFFLGNFIMERYPAVSDEILRIIFGIACISGHNWTIFLRFKGGKGIATTLGVLLGLSIKIVALKLVLGSVIFTWLLVLVFFRFVSLSSIIAGISLPVYLFVFKHSGILICLGIILAIFTILRHKQNIKRIIQRKEPRLF
ncbi:MAG: glycerol-3-phosphate 1-O-acyltransferase PlsY [Candidatus Omnitrophica bacterium]|nr:glycerol-3-phosphate 1-O-acyltransferase PlsY [Candidatus Omnitrophota bacterium]